MSNSKSNKLPPDDLENVTGGNEACEEATPTPQKCMWCEKMFTGQEWYHKKGFCSNNCELRFDLHVNKI